MAGSIESFYNREHLLSTTGYEDSFESKAMRQATADAVSVSMGVGEIQSSQPDSPHRRWRGEFLSHIWGARHTRVLARGCHAQH